MGRAHLRVASKWTIDTAELILSAAAARTRASGPCLPQHQHHFPTSHITRLNKAISIDFVENLRRLMSKVGQRYEWKEVETSVEKNCVRRSSLLETWLDAREAPEPRSRGVFLAERQHSSFYSQLLHQIQDQELCKYACVRAPLCTDRCASAATVNRNGPTGALISIAYTTLRRQCGSTGRCCCGCKYSGGAEAG